MRRDEASHFGISPILSRHMTACSAKCFTEGQKFDSVSYGTCGRENKTAPGPTDRPMKHVPLRPSVGCAQVSRRVSLTMVLSVASGSFANVLDRLGES
jgi:hypothetical protein